VRGGYVENHSEKKDGSGEGAMCWIYW